MGIALNRAVFQTNPGNLSKEISNRRERHRTETRERLIRCSLSLFVRRGFGATTIEDITNAADVGKGTFFNYFPSKEHILATLVTREVQKVRGFISKIIHSRDPISRVLFRLASVMTEEYDRSPALVSNILIPFFSSGYCRQEMAAALQTDPLSVAEFITLRQKSGEIRDDLSPVEGALMFHRALLGTVAVWSLIPSKPLSDCLQEMSRVLWLGIKSQKEDGGKKQRTKTRRYLGRYSAGN